MSDNNNELNEKIQKMKTVLNDISIDRFTRSTIIHETLHVLIECIFRPFKIESQIRIYNVSFDGIIHLYEDTDIFFEIKTSQINEYLFEQFKSMVDKIKINKNTYFILISPENPINRVSSISKYNKSVNLRYLDFNTLIELYRFVEKRFIKVTEKDKLVKKFFLEKLFEHDEIDNNNFDSSYKYAKKKIDENITEIDVNTINNIIVKYENTMKKYESRVYLIEEKLNEVLNEIEQLKKEMKLK